MKAIVQTVVLLALVGSAVQAHTENVRMMHKLSSNGGKRIFKTDREGTFQEPEKKLKKSQDTAGPTCNP